MNHSENLDIEKEMQTLERRKSKLLRLLKLRGEVAELERAMSTDAKVILNIITEEVCAKFKLSMEALMSQCREENVCVPRQLVFYLGHEIKRIPCTQIGRAFQRNHATVLYACQSIKNRMETDEAFSETVSSVMASCKARLETGALIE